MTKRTPKAAGPEMFGPSAPVSGRVLVVDDNEINCKLVKEALLAAGCQVIIAEDGFSGYKAAVNEKPDLILLDVMMPNIDGYQVCAKLKKNPETREIPVIFITALDKIEQVLKGFELGGVDYITKPVMIPEMTARVNAHLRLRKLEEERARMIEERMKAEHWRAIEAISEGLAHNCNNLLAAAISNADYIMAQITAPDLKEAAEDLRDSLGRMAQLVRLLRTFQELAPETNPIALKELIEEAAEKIKPRLQQNQTLELELAGRSETLAPAPAACLRRALAAGLENAREALSPDGGEIRLRLERVPEGAARETLLLRIEDNGRGLTPQVQEMAFLPFFSTKNIVGAGLGLYAAKLAIEQMGGTIELGPRPGGGASLVITLPAAEAE